MEQKKVELYPIVGMQVNIATDDKVVIMHLPYIRGFGTPSQEELQDRAYCLLPEQAVMLRDALDNVINHINAGGRSAPPQIN